MDFIRIIASPKARVMALALLLNLGFSPLLAADSAPDYASLEKKFQLISNNIYYALAKDLGVCKQRASNLKRLNVELSKLNNSNSSPIGLCLIRNHFSLIKKDIDSKEAFTIFDYLLNNNDTTLANKIYRIAKNESDQSFISNLSFIYAKYYIKLKQWRMALNHLKGTYNDLTKKDSDLALLYTGNALQKIKQHRKAVEVYKKINPKSEFYPAARLNIATAYIRQGWWTDAQIQIEEVINNKKVDTHNEMINRYYLVLGYSLLRKEFHRDSREAFRNIELDSIYFNKALLGIALTAANQEDYIGSLNAINILRGKQKIDLSVDESHLLQPYIYEKLNQHMTASASYTGAQNYYRQRIEYLTESKNDHHILTQELLKNGGQFKIDNTIIDFPKDLPIGVISNKAQLEKIEAHLSSINNKSLLGQVQRLREKYNLAIKNVTDKILNNRIAYLERYMNQSRYGIARLFDHSNKEN